MYERERERDNTRLPKAIILSQIEDNYANISQQQIDGRDLVYILYLCTNSLYPTPI